MSRGKRGTCNYKMMTFRISIRNLKYIKWLGEQTKQTKGQAINSIINYIRETNSTYHEKEEIHPRQTTLDFDENKMD